MDPFVLPNAEKTNSPNRSCCRTYGISPAVTSTRSAKSHRTSVSRTVLTTPQYDHMCTACMQRAWPPSSAFFSSFPVCNMARNPRASASDSSI
eukprot:1215208-Rhodomonas_salina.1